MTFGQAFSSTYQPQAPISTDALEFGFLVDPPGRDTEQQISERLPIGGGDPVIDLIGKPTTKIRGRGRLSSYNSLKTFEGAVGSVGTLVYSEEPSGVLVIFVAMHRDRVLLNGEQLAGMEFWLLPPDADISGL